MRHDQDGKSAQELKEKRIGLALCVLYVLGLLAVHASVPPALRLW